MRTIRSTEISDRSLPKPEPQEHPKPPTPTPTPPRPAPSGNPTAPPPPPLTDTPAARGWQDNLAGDGQFFAIFDDGHHRQLPRLTGRPFRQDSRSWRRQPPQPHLLPNPHLLDDVRGRWRRTSVARSRPPRERVSIDFTEGRLANKELTRATPGPARHAAGVHRPEQPGPGPASSADERRNIGIHTCPGGDNDSVHSKEVPYEKLLNKMFQMNAGYFLIQCASEEDKETVYELVGQNLREDADGVTQMAFIGVINPLSPEVETPERYRDRLVARRTSRSPSRGHRRLRPRRSRDLPGDGATRTTPATGDAKIPISDQGGHGCELERLRTSVVPIRAGPPRCAAGGGLGAPVGNYPQVVAPVARSRYAGRDTFEVGATSSQDVHPGGKGWWAAVGVLPDHRPARRAQGAAVELPDVGRLPALAARPPPKARRRSWT